MRRRKGNARGFTLVEMITVVFILSLILSLLTYEFVNVINSTFHTRANTDAESTARLAMIKVGQQMRTAYWDYVDFPNPSPPAGINNSGIASPLPGPTQNYVAFYRVSQGGLDSMPAPCAKSTQPCAPFELVTIQLSATKPGELDEIITPINTGIPGSPMPIAQNVQDFEVSADQTFTNRYNVTIAVAEPSNHCTNNHCTFTLNDAILTGDEP